MARGGAVAEDSARWFTRLGVPINRAELEAATFYAAALSIGQLGIERVPNITFAHALTCDADWDSRWWTIENDERRSLMNEACARLGSEPLLDALTVAVEPYTEPSLARALAAPALAASGETVARAASGALLMSVHCRALAMLSGRGAGHVFMRKYALFSLGRWPLGLRGDVLFVF